VCAIQEEQQQQPYPSAEAAQELLIWQPPPQQQLFHFISTNIRDPTDSSSMGADLCSTNALKVKAHYGILCILFKHSLKATCHLI
jgi:hypothetical protein